MKNVDDEGEFGYKARQLLNQGTDTLGSNVVSHLYAARQKSLDHQRLAITGLRLAGLAQLIEGPLHFRARNLVAMLALVIGAMGTYYWNEFQQASEYEEIDSALLADELPPSAYLDRGFHAWLERNSASPSQ